MAVAPPGERPPPPPRFSGHPLDPWEASGLGSGLGRWWGQGSPRVLALPSLPCSKVTRKPLLESDGAGRPRSPGRAQAWASGRHGQPAPLRGTSCGTAPSRGPSGQGAPGPPGTRPGPTSGSRRLPLTPVGLSRDCRPSVAKAWGARDRGGGAAHLGQVRSSDSPSGRNRCSPAQHPGPGQTQASRFVPKAGAQECLAFNSLESAPPRPGLGAEARPAQPALRTPEPRRNSLEIPPTLGHLLWLCSSSALPPGSLP